MSESSEIVLSVEGLRKSFAGSSGNDLPVLDGLSLSLCRGKISSILGASGCGKSTLLKLIAGTEPVEVGTICSKLERPSKEIGYLQQSERLLPWRNVIENVALGLELIGASYTAAISSAESRLEEVGMLAFASSYPSHLSGGMTQRVLVARTLITEPSMLLLDEPLGQLDIVARQDIAKIIRSYVKKHQAVALLATHSVEEAIFISDAVYTLSRRPSRITEAFEISDDADGSDGTVFDRRVCYETIKQALLRTLGAHT